MKKEYIIPSVTSVLYISEPLCGPQVNSVRGNSGLGPGGADPGNEDPL